MSPVPPNRVDYTQSEDGKFQVKSFSHVGEAYVIDLKEGTCSCKAWEFGKRPCKHMIYVEMEERRKGKTEEREPGDESETEAVPE